VIRRHNARIANTPLIIEQVYAFPQGFSNQQRIGREPGGKFYVDDKVNHFIKMRKTAKETIVKEGGALC
jgi:hypothetical protein